MCGHVCGMCTARVAEVLPRLLDYACSFLAGTVGCLAVTVALPMHMPCCAEPANSWLWSHAPKLTQAGHSRWVPGSTLNLLKPHTQRRILINMNAILVCVCVLQLPLSCTASTC